MYRLNITSFIGLLSALLLSFSGCGPDKTPSSQKTEGGDDRIVIRLAGGDWGYPTPYAHYPRGPGGFKMCLIFDSLLERGPEGVIPWLAEDWKVSSDGLTYTFTIRDGATWHDGTPLTAADVEFSLQYACRHPMVWSHISADDIAGISIHGNREVVVTVTEPRAALLEQLGRTRIIPQHIWADIEHPRQFTGRPAVTGSGPFRLAHYNREQGLYRFEALADFWGPQPAVDSLEFIPVSQPVPAFENGYIDLAHVPPDLVSRFENRAETKLVRPPGFWGYRMLFNPDQNPILGEVSFRQALALAIDRRELVRKAARGAAQPGSPGIIPPDHRLYNPDIKHYRYAPGTARQLLQGIESEYGSGRGEIQLRLLVSNRNREVRLATLIREQLKAVDIEIEVHSCDAKSRDSKVRKGDYELAIIGHGGWGADPDYLYDRFYPQPAASDSPSASGNRVRVSTELADMLRHLHVETDDTRRPELVFKVQPGLAEEIPELPLYYTTGAIVYDAAKYDGWTFMYDHHALEHSKLSYLRGWKKQLMTADKDDK